MAVMNDDQAVALREPFPASMIGKLPKAGIQLDYVGHAAVTDRLLKVDPTWSWEPVAFTAAGGPLVYMGGSNAVMWIRLTVCGVTRLGVGIVKSDAFELEKQLISDAIRNAAMRFGVALDLWSKEELWEQPAPEGVDAATGEIGAGDAASGDAGGGTSRLATSPAPSDVPLATKPQRAKIDHLVDQTGAIPETWPLPDDFTKVDASRLIDHLLTLPVEPPAERVATLRDEAEAAQQEFVS